MNKSFSTTDVDGLGLEDTPLQFVALRNKRLREEDLPTEFVKFKDEMKEFISSIMARQTMQLKVITEDLKSIRDTNTNIDSSILLLTSQNEELRKRVEILETQSKTDHEYAKVLEQKVEDLQRTLRKTSIEIKNVPKAKEEKRDDLINMVLNLSKTINLNMNSSDVRDIYRLPGKDGSMKNTPIIVELGSAILKSDLLQKTKSFNIKNKNKLQARHLNHKTNEDSPVFVSEQLTPKGARLFFLSRDLVKSKKFKYCWTSFGKILVRQDDNSRIIQINNESQIHQLMQDT